MKTIKRYIVWLLIALFLAAFSSAVLGADPKSYPRTIEALQARYADEVTAHQKYGAFAEHALKEGYPAIAGDDDSG